MLARAWRGIWSEMEPVYTAAATVARPRAAGCGTGVSGDDGLAHDVAQLAVGLLELPLEVLGLLLQAVDVVGERVLARLVVRVDLGAGLLDEPGVRGELERRGCEI